MFFKFTQQPRPPHLLIWVHRSVTEEGVLFDLHDPLGLVGAATAQPELRVEVKAMSE